LIPYSLNIIEWYLKGFNFGRMKMNKFVTDETPIATIITGRLNDTEWGLYSGLMKPKMNYENSNVQLHVWHGKSD
jgi:hypothetical protein